jgi:gluconokinase
MADTTTPAAPTAPTAATHAPRRGPEPPDIFEKGGMKDGQPQRLNERLAEIGLPPGTVQTMFEFIDLDEGRSKVGSR